MTFDIPLLPPGSAYSKNMGEFSHFLPTLWKHGRFSTNYGHESGNTCTKRNWFFKTCYHFSILLTRFINVYAFCVFAYTLLERGRFLFLCGHEATNLTLKTGFTATFTKQPLLGKTICENLKGIGYEF